MSNTTTAKPILPGATIGIFGGGQTFGSGKEVRQ